MQRPLELCQWDDLEALPPVGEEYQQGFKLVNDRLPKRIGKSRWRQLELCWWPDQEALPAKGKEYPGLGKFLASTQAGNIAETFPELEAAIEAYMQENEDVAEVQHDVVTNPEQQVDRSRG
ncbi:hypothetical protein QJQ45_001591 [Haematococcus lacustris]|nr:hypothetical protein QJQ45_001591 [Haematococcus lacustris]